VASRRFILLLDARYEAEKDMLKTVKAVPKGEGAPFVRALMALGYKDLRKDRSMHTVGGEQGPKETVNEG